MEPFIIAVLGVTICAIGGLISLLTLLFSIISWILIPRWRNIKNYAFLNIIISFNVIYLLPTTLLNTNYFMTHETSYLYITLDIAVNFFMFSAGCWLMVMAMLFYADLVTVFNSVMTRKFLKSNIFGYGIPTFVTSVKVTNKIIFLYKSKLTAEDETIYQNVFYYEEIGQNVVLFILLVTNFCVYVRVIFSLMRTRTVWRTSNHSQKIQVATLAFVMSGVVLMMSVLMTLLMLIGSKDKYYLYPIGLGLYGIQTTVINVCYFRSKGNRRLWIQYLDGVRRKRMQMEQNVECEMGNVKQEK